MADFLVSVFVWFMVRAVIIAAVLWVMWLVFREWTAPWRHRHMTRWTRRRLLRQAGVLRDHAAYDDFEPMTPEAMEARGWLTRDVQLQQQMEEEW